MGNRTIVVRCQGASGNQLTIDNRPAAVTRQNNGIAVARYKHVIAFTTDDSIVARTGIDYVIAITSVNGVVAGTGIDGVIAAIGDDIVLAITCLYGCPVFSRNRYCRSRSRCRRGSRSRRCIIAGCRGRYRSGSRRCIIAGCRGRCRSGSRRCIIAGCRGRYRGRCWCLLTCCGTCIAGITLNLLQCLQQQRQQHQQRIGVTTTQDAVGKKTAEQVVESLIQTG